MNTSKPDVPIMAHVLLSDTDDWQLVHDEQDLRGRDLLDAGGLRIGQIADMVINTETEHIDEVVLTDGARYPAADLDIEDEAVYLRGAATVAGRTAFPYEGVRRTDPISGADTVYTERTISGTSPEVPPATPATISGADARDYVRSSPLDSDAEYESHYGTEYAATGNPFSFYRPAYRFGTEMSLDQGYLGTSFDDVETSLRERWMTAFPGQRYDDYRGAIRYGFERRRSV